MRITKPRFAMAALAVGGALAFAVPAGAAVNLQSESPGGQLIKITKQAKLKANGAATVVTVTVTCPYSSYFGVQAEVTQTVGGIITSGSGDTVEFACTGGAQKVKVAVTPSTMPFQPGQAYAEADLLVRSWNYNYTYAQTGRVIVNVAS